MRLSFMIFSALVVASTSAWADEPTGDWLVEDGNAQIRIENCGGALWGFVAWEKNPGGRDAQNPDPSKRDRPTLGLPILLNMQQAQSAPGRWDGEVYNAQNGKTYTSHISLVDADTLRIEGCVLGFLCGGQNWTRAAPPEPTATAAAKPKPGAKTAAAPPPKAAPAAAHAAPKPPAGAMAANVKRPAGAGARPAAGAKPEESALCSTLPQLAGTTH